MAASEVIRVRIEPEVKESLSKMYAARGTTISQSVRSFLYGELEREATAPDRFDAIMAAADARLESSGEPDVSLEDIVAFVDGVRDERRASAFPSAG